MRRRLRAVWKQQCKGQCLHQCKRRCDGTSRGDNGPGTAAALVRGQKRAIVAESLVLGAVVSDVARRADIGPGQIYRWRKEFRAVADGSAQVLIAPPEIAAAQVAAGEPTIELDPS